ncbi:putative holin [Yersinia intermedia]|uniref:putative holin n=1 Tax=Yersinia intermedia TaxID=631 RepID=UPI001CFC7C78|nr:putative holin [Yersinia intermedia]MCB5312097.1 phage holin family protein [Yersinia intermedia]MCB5326157.1 phage holin family protein [Yersinia intermedia]
MADPISGVGVASWAVTGITFVGLLSGVDAGAVVGAFAGSVLFVVLSGDFTKPVKGMLFIVSMIVGVLSADFVASIITAITPESVTAARPLGAIVSSAVAVRLLIALSNQAGNPTSFFERLIDKIADKFKGSK